VDVRTIPSKKSWIKLLEAAEKLKKTLTPNGVNEAQCNLECLYQEYDFRGKITQKNFDTMFAGMKSKVAPPIKEALRQAKLTPADVSSVQLIGGSTRIPLIRKEIAQAMGTPMDKQNYGLKCTLNPDECVARGCALQCAILSPLLRVRAYTIKNVITQPIRIKWMQPSVTGDAPRPQHINLFKAGDPFPAYKRVTFKRNDSFTITAEYCGKDTTDKLVGRFDVGGHEDMKTMDSPKIKVNIAYNADGIFNIQSAHFMKEKPPEPEPEPKPEPEKPKEEKPAAEKTEASDKPTDEEKKAEAGAGAEKAKESGEEPKKADTDEKAKKEDEAKKPEEKKPEEKKPEEPPKPKFVQVVLGVKSSITGALPKAKIDAYRNREAGLAQEERIARERDERRNDLETYVYDIRDKVESYDFETFMLPDAREAYVAKLEDTENWLYTDEGNDSSKKVYVDKLADLRVVGDRVLALKRERENIGEAVENFKLARTKDLSVVNSEDEKFAHLTKEERESVRSTWSKGLEFVEEGIAKNASLKNHEDLAITIVDIVKKQTECVGTCRPTVTKPKPKPKPKPEEPKKDEAKASDGKAEEGKAETDGAKPEEGKADAAAAEGATAADKAEKSESGAKDSDAGEGDPTPPVPDEVD